MEVKLKQVSERDTNGFLCDKFSNENWQFCRKENIYISDVFCRFGLTKGRIKLICWCLHKKVWLMYFFFKVRSLYNHNLASIITLQNSYLFFYLLCTTILSIKIIEFFSLEIGKGKLTVGKIYGGLLILENWKTTKFGRIPNSQRPVKRSSINLYSDTYLYRYLSTYI